MRADSSERPGRRGATITGLIGGRTLSHYEITAKLGAGGMGEVWRATDTSLHRDVAIKVLPAEFVDDPERLARFEREAHLLASLNHPHIAAIHGLDEDQGIRFLVLELVEGETLEEILERGPIPVDRALAIALQMTQALEAAHEKGIVHRDLKPANVKITAAGSSGVNVKVLDFGLAKAGEHESQGRGDLSVSPTLTAQMTQAGVILGSAGYMSPEQARGQMVDKRSDIWSFGVILYEMLAGRRAFDGETVTDLIAAVVTSDPDTDHLPAEIPRRLRRLLGRCLEKDALVRLRDIG